MSHDGIFYTENVAERYEKFDFESNIRYIIGSNSFEGNLLLADDYEFVAENVTVVFDILSGYEHGQVTMGRK